MPNINTAERLHYTLIVSTTLSFFAVVLSLLPAHKSIGRYARLGSTKFKFLPQIKSVRLPFFTLFLRLFAASVVFILGPREESENGVV